MAALGAPFGGGGGLSGEGVDVDCPGRDFGRVMDEGFDPDDLL